MKKKIKQALTRVPGLYAVCEKIGLSGRLFLLRRLPKESVGVEIGVHEGDFSARILAVVKPRKLFLVDPWIAQSGDAAKSWFGSETMGGQACMDLRYEKVRERFRAEISEGCVELVRAFSDIAASLFEDESLDWVYIDGNHLYESVKKDLELYSAKVKPGGILAGDDYTSGGWWKGGVKKAVDEYLLSPGVEKISIRNGQFLIRRR